MPKTSTQTTQETILIRKEMKEKKNGETKDQGSNLAQSKSLGIEIGTKFF